MAALPPSPNPQYYGPSDPADDPNRKQAEATLAKLAAKIIPKPQGQSAAPQSTPQPVQSQPAPQTGNPQPSSQPATPDPLMAGLDPDFGLAASQKGEESYAKALDTLSSSPAPKYDAPTFQQPNKTQAIIATALSLLFPGSKIANFASHYGEGMEKGAEDRYARAEDQAKNQYQAAQDARAAQVQGVEALGKKAQLGDTRYEKELGVFNARENAANTKEYHDELAAAAKERADNAARTLDLRAQDFHHKWKHQDEDEKRLEFVSQTGRLQYQRQVQKDASWLYLGVRGQNIGMDKVRLTKSVDYVIANLHDANAMARTQVTQAGADSRNAANIAGRQNLKAAEENITPAALALKAAIQAQAKGDPGDETLEKNVQDAKSKYDTAVQKYMPAAQAASPTLHNINTDPDSFGSDENYDPYTEGGGSSGTNVTVNIPSLLGNGPGGIGSIIGGASGTSSVGGIGGGGFDPPQVPRELNGVTPQLLDRVRTVESNGQDVTSKAGAIGPYQFMPDTAKAYGVNPHDEKSARAGAARYIADLQKYFGGDMVAAMAAYNTGPATVTEARAQYGQDWENHLPDETKGYIKKIFAPEGEQPYVPTQPFHPSGVDPHATPTAAGTVKPTGPVPRPKTLTDAFENAYLNSSHEDREAFLNDPRIHQDVKNYLRQEGAAGQITHAPSDPVPLAQQPKPAAPQTLGGGQPAPPRFPPQAPVPQARQSPAPPPQGPANTPQPSPQAGAPPQPLSSQAQALQAQKMKQLMPYAQFLIRSSKPPQVIIKLLEGRGLTPDMASQLFQQATKAAQTQPPQPAA